MTLLEKLEAAAEGSRELDAQIHTAATGETAMQDPWGTWCKGDDWKDRVALNHSRFEVPHYTTSIDAALTLVPWGDYDQHWTRSTRGDARHKLWQIRIALETVEEDADETGPVALGQADTPALALCIAALRARPQLLDEVERLTRAFVVLIHEGNVSIGRVVKETGLTHADLLAANAKIIAELEAGMGERK